MGKLRSGILGQIRGKVAGVVGGTWKDVNYLREYVIPANPQTAAQTTQRTKFADAVAFGKPLVGPVFNEWVDPFQTKMSGFNWFIKANIAYFTPVPVWANITITTGKLFEARITSMDADSGANTVQVIWSVSLGSNGAADDPVNVLCYNRNTGRWGFGAAAADRDQGAVGISVPLNMSPGDVIQCYAIATQFIGTKLSLVATSDTDDTVAAV